MKVLFGFFSEDMSFASSIYTGLAEDNGWDVEQIYFPDRISDENISKLIENCKPDLIALSFRTFERSEAFKVANMGHKYGIKVIAGGIHPSSCPQDLKMSGFFDGIIIGDGAGIFIDLLNSYKSLEGQLIKGKEHDNIEVYFRRRFTESQKNRLKTSKTLEILTSLGCPYNCRFCSGSKKLIEFPIESIVNQIVFYNKHYGINKLIIYDDLFTFKIDRVKQFRNLMEKNHIENGYLHIQGRCNCFDDEMAKELKELGVEEVSFGVETVSDRLLKFLNKRITVKDQYRTAEICRRNGIAFKITLMFGLPTQTQQDYEATFNFVKQTLPDAMTLYYFLPFPGSELFNFCVDNGYFPSDFNFDTFLGIDKNSTEFIGFREQSIGLQKIDYQMASKYFNAIQNFDQERKDKTIFQTAKMADKENWILFGSGDYFNKVLERLSTKKWSNCLGYYDYTPNKYRQKKFNIKIPLYKINETKGKPKTVVVTTHKGKIFQSVDLQILQSKLDFKGTILSTSTY